MSKSKVEQSGVSPLSFLKMLRRLLNLRADTDMVGATELIRADVDFKSANAWTLVFAIFVASVGLNVNSTAVVIGAMLISPLMGPIVGFGLALGTNDFALLKRSAKNLAAAVIISVVASTIYFAISPLSEVQSEILSRTRPSFFDVLIAFFGGAAGIVAISRKEKGNAIPGVAIATALMPPLCTAGFGLATGNFGYFLGAMYLFIINCVFISISTFIFVRYLGFHKVSRVDSRQEKSLHRWIAYVGGVVLIPSFFMAWYLQRESFFKSQANKYIAHEFISDKFIVVDRDFEYGIRDSHIKIRLLGESLEKGAVDSLKQLAVNYSLLPNMIEIQQSNFSDNLERKAGEKISAAESLNNQLQMKLNKAESDLNELRSLETLSQSISDELGTIFPKRVNRVYISKKSSSNEGSKIESLNVLVEWRSTPSHAEVKTATAFLVKRTGAPDSQVTHARRM